MSQIQNSFLQRNRVSQPSLLAKQRKTNVILFSISLIFFVTWLPFRYLSVFVFFTFSQYIQGICKCICLCHLPSFQVFVFVFVSSLSPSSLLYFILTLLYLYFTLSLLINSQSLLLGDWDDGDLREHRKHDDGLFVFLFILIHTETESCENRSTWFSTSSESHRAAQTQSSMASWMTTFKRWIIIIKYSFYLENLPN